MARVLDPVAVASELGPARIIPIPLIRSRPASLRSVQLPFRLAGCKQRPAAETQTGAQASVGPGTDQLVPSPFATLLPFGGRAAPTPFPPFDAVDSVQENRRTDPSTDRYNTNQVQSPTLTPDTTHRHRPATSLKTRTLTINAERCIRPPRTGQKLGTRAGTTRAREPKTCPSVSGKRRLIRPYFHVPTIHGRDVPDSLPDPADLRRQ